MDAYLHRPQERCALRVHFKSDEARETTVAVLVALVFAEDMRRVAPADYEKTLNEFVAHVSTLRSLEARMLAAVVISMKNGNALLSKWVQGMFVAYPKEAESMVLEIQRRKLRL